jgi:uncharacterized membrane protein YgcG
MGSRIFIAVVLTILAFYWLPTVPAIFAVAIVLFLVLHTPTKRAVQRGRRIIAARGKHDDMIANFYWKESMVHALFLGAMAGGVLGSEAAFGSNYAGDAGADVGGHGDGGGHGDFGGHADFGGHGGGADMGGGSF